MIAPDKYASTLVRICEKCGLQRKANTSRRVKHCKEWMKFKFLKNHPFAKE